MAQPRTFKIGTRASPLARWQAEWVAGALRETAKVDVELVLITTQGDDRSEGPIGQIGTQGVFTKELQRALLENQIDLAVHSLKDLPTEPVRGLSLVAVPLRAPAGDCLVSRRGESLVALPQRAIVGTGSTRRRAQLLHARPDLDLRDIRGNVDTRIRKLLGGEYDALVLAEAGLTRLGMEERITERIPPNVMLPAVGQGALGIETRTDDTAVRDVVLSLDDPDTHYAVIAERALLHTLRGGCLAPVAAWARVVERRLRLQAAVLSADGKQKIEAAGEGERTQGVRIGQAVGQQLLDQGAAELIEAARG